MSKPSYDEINIAIQNADLTHFQINKLVKALERKRSHAVLAIMPIEPSYQSIETLNEAKVKISELEKQCESYQANVDAMIHVFERDEQLNVIRRPNGKIEPYYSSSQWTEMFRAISERAAINLIDYAMDYLFRKSVV